MYFLKLVFKKSKYTHGVYKSQKKSHSTLWAQQTTFTYWVDKTQKFIKNAKNAQFGEF